MGCQCCKTTPESIQIITAEEEWKPIAESQPIVDRAKEEEDKLKALEDASDLQKDLSSEELWPAPIVDRKESEDESTESPMRTTLSEASDVVEDNRKPSNKFKAAVYSVKWTNKSPSCLSVGVPEGTKVLKAAGNANRPGDYGWLQQTMERISRNDFDKPPCKDMTTGKAYFPMFFLIGACPNALCGMQAVMFCRSVDQVVDFWWVKPSKDNPKVLERETLNRHGAGTHKNDPGRSKPVMEPVAKLFAEGSSVNGWKFGIEEVDGEDGIKIPRAFILEEARTKAGAMYIIMMWQEDWTSNPFSRSKYIKGKFIYQKTPAALAHWSRQVEVIDGNVFIAPFEQAAPDTVLPDKDIKVLFDWRENRT